jgi:hypothetical protein
MSKGASEDPAVQLSTTIKKSLYDQMESIRGDVSRARWVERAIEAKLRVKK